MARVMQRSYGATERRRWTGSTRGRTPHSASGSKSGRFIPWILGLVAVVGLVVSIALVIPVTGQGILHAAGGPATTLGRVAGLAGTYLLLITLLLIGRIPLIERVVGQDKLLRVHRWLGPAVLILLATHVVALTVGYAQQAQTGALHGLWVMIVSFPGILMATAGLGLLTMARSSP